MPDESRAAVPPVDAWGTPAAPCRSFFSSAEGLKPQATFAWISRRSSLIRRIARANPASVDPSAYS